MSADRCALWRDEVRLRGHAAEILSDKAKAHLAGEALIAHAAIYNTFTVQPHLNRRAVVRGIRGCSQGPF